jgi:hypothetical protein
MQNSAGTLIYLFIGYLCGVVFAPDIFSANILATNWYNIWVYAWIFGWPIMLALHYVMPIFTTPTIVVVKP